MLKKPDKSAKRKAKLKARKAQAVRYPELPIPNFDSPAQPEQNIAQQP